MFPTQHIQLDKEDFDKLFKLYKEHKEHYIRQRAHLILLRHENYSVSSISDILWQEDYYVLLYIKAWHHFGMKGFLSDEIEELYERIKELETIEPIEVPPLIDWEKFLNYLGVFLKSIYSFLEKIVIVIATFMLTSFLWIVSKIKAIDYKKFYIPFNNSITNKLSIGRDSNNNVVFQMINVFSEEKESETENKIASSLEDTKKQFIEIFQKQKNFISDSQMIALFLAMNDKVQQIKDKEKRKRFLAVLATAAAMYVYYHTSIKGGLVLFTFLGMTITLINFNSTDSLNISSIDEEGRGINSHFTDSLLQVQERTQFRLDSIAQEINMERRIDSLIRLQEIADSLARIEIIEDDEECYFFAKKNEYVSRLIDEDTKDYTSEKYFVNYYERDERFFLIAKEYEDIYEAAFQRKYLIDKGYKKSKIIEIRDNESIRYGLSIDEFTNSKFDDALYQTNDWESLCEKYKPKIYHNGICKIN